MEILFGAIVALFTAAIGYYLGTIKFFREHQLRVYGDILPHILRTIYRDPTDVMTSKGDCLQERREMEFAFNRALAHVWLYCSRDVALKADEVARRLAKPGRGSLTEAAQALVAAMRADVQRRWPTYRQPKLEPNEIKHLYSRVRALHAATGRSADDDDYP